MKTRLFCSLILTTRLLAGSPADENFVAHEWGTFTSVQGADGVQLEWNPIIKTDLPKFVYSRAFPTGIGRNAGNISVPFKDVMPSFVCMETPVIYFYSGNEVTADVRVAMPQGRITEWYPRATRLGPYATTNKTDAQASRSFIEWIGVKILGRGTKEISSSELIRENNGNHYYEARETDANFVRVASPYGKSGAEYERDLFYRGVGFFKAPLTMEFADDENQLLLSTESAAPLTDLFVLTIRSGMARYQFVDRVSKNERRAVRLAAKPFASLSDVRPQIMREMAARLTHQGLYAKEAQAMVKTWADQWFTEEGTRVLYLLPRVWTDETLPLWVSPAPNEIVRVMIGRAELITPAMETSLRKQAERFRAGDDSARSEAVANVRQLGLGRFLEPATRKMLGKDSSKELAQAAWKLAQEASKAIPAKGSDVKTATVPIFDHLAAH